MNHDSNSGEVRDDGEFFAVGEPRPTDADTVPLQFWEKAAQDGDFSKLLSWFDQWRQCSTDLPVCQVVYGCDCEECQRDGKTRHAREIVSSSRYEIALRKRLAQTVINPNKERTRITNRLALAERIEKAKRAKSDRAFGGWSVKFDKATSGMLEQKKRALWNMLVCDMPPRVAEKKHGVAVSTLYPAKSRLLEEIGKCPDRVKGN